MKMEILPQILLIAASVFFALNMGGSGMAPAFSAALGANILDRKRALALFTVFVIAGALILGKNVVKTLGSGIVPASVLNPSVVLIIIFSASLSLFLANILRVPQSTSWVTVFSIATTGVYFSNLQIDIILYKLLPAWILLPLTGFIITSFVVRIFYPLRKGNYGFYEQFTKHEWKMKMFVIATSCYVAFAIGSNNVANVVGPLSGAQVIDPVLGLALAAPLFGIGGTIFRSATKTVAKEIVPLGAFTAGIVKFVAGTLLITASALGIPQSLVQLNVACVIAVSATKDGDGGVYKHRTIRKVFFLWLITPLIASALTLILLEMFA